MNREPNLCKFEDGLETIIGKWKLTILIYIIQYEKLRFSDLLKLMPKITQKTLSNNLKELEENDLVKREMFQGIPPKVEYSLTEHGKEIIPVIDQLHEWGINHKLHIQKKWLENK